MPKLPYSAPPPSLMNELREVATDADHLVTELAKAQNLPAGFPTQQLTELMLQLGALPEGTAEGCREPLEYARGRLPALRRQFILTEEQSARASTDADAPPPLTRGMSIDNRLGALVNSVTTALDEYRALASAQDDDAADTSPSLEIDATAPDVVTAAAAARKAEEALSDNVAKLEEIAMPGSAVADSLKRQMHDTKGLLSLARIELRMPAFIPRWYRKTIDTITDYPAILRRTAGLMQSGVDVARPLSDAWHHFKHGFDTLVLDSVERAGKGLSAVADQWEEKKSKRGDAPADTAEPPSDFYLAEAHTLILAGQAPPHAWWPWLSAMNFAGTRLADLGPLANLTALQSLDLARTQVSDVSPLTGLTALQSLNLDGTQVGNVSPLAGLTALQSLNLFFTKVSDVSPLAGLNSLQSLNLMATQVRNVLPLARLAALQSVDLSGTHVSDLSPLAGLTALQSLILMSTEVSDLSPLAGLTALQSLNLSGTQVSDLSPLAGLTALQSLDLMYTQVSDLSPLAGLTALQSLSLAGMQVSDVSPLADLAALQSLILMSTEVSDVSPLAGLTALKSLDLRGTKVSDVSPLAGLTALQSLRLDGTQVRNVSPLWHIRGLRITGQRSP